MALPKDKEPETPEPPAGPEPAGRVEFDSRGNSVWRWARDVLDSTSILLKRLENKDLAIEPTQRVPVVRDGKADPAGRAGKPGKGGTPGRGGTPGKPVTPGKPGKPGTAGTPGKPDKKSARATPADLSVSAEPRARDGGGFDPYNSRR